MTATTVPGYSARKRSSHATVSASRWFVGSSRSRRSGACEQQPAERDAAPLAARQLLDVAVAVGEPERVHREVERRVERPRVGAVDLLLHLRLLGEQRVEVGVRVGELGRDLVEAVEQLTQRAHAVLDVPAHVLRRVEPWLLLEQPDGRARAEWRLPARSPRPGHDPQQRRLPSAVGPEHADLRARQKRERDVPEHLALRAIELLDPEHPEHVVAHRRATITVCRRVPAAVRRAGTTSCSTSGRRGAT